MEVHTNDPQKLAAIVADSEVSYWEWFRQHMAEANGEWVKAPNGELYPNPDWHVNANRLNRQRRLANMTPRQREVYTASLAKISEYDCDVALVLAEVLALQIDKCERAPVESVLLTDAEKNQLRPFVPVPPKRRGPRPVDVFEVIDSLLELSAARKSLGGGGKNATLYARVTSAVSRGEFQVLIDTLPLVEIDAQRRARLRNLLELYQNRFAHVVRS